MAPLPMWPSFSSKPTTSNETCAPSGPVTAAGHGRPATGRLPAVVSS